MVNAGLSPITEPSIYSLAADFLAGDAEFFGVPQTGRFATKSVHDLLVWMLDSFGIDVDRMHEHYFMLIQK
jgi:hypothetical protein